MAVWLAGVGFVSLLGQVVLARELNVAFYGTELIYVLALGLWLLWTAAGAAMGRRGFVPAPETVRVILLLLGGSLPVSVVFIRGARLLFGAVPGAYLPFAQQMLVMLLALLPAGVFCGLAFQWAAKLYIGTPEKGQRTLARAYAVESAGALLGGLAATELLRWGVANFATGLLCAFLAALAAGYPLGQPRPRWLSASVSALLIACLGGLAAARRLDFGLTALNHPRMAASQDTPYGRVTVDVDRGQVAVFVNNALAFESEGTAAEEFVHPVALQHPGPKRALLLGGGVSGLVAAMAQHDSLQILDHVELNEALLEMATRELPEEIRTAMASGPVRTKVADPRQFLLTRTAADPTAEPYDLIIVGMPEPASGLANRYYTREFFALCHRHLAPNGVLGLRLEGSENLMTAPLRRRTGSIYRALKQVFADVIVLPGSTFVVVASRAELVRDPELLASRLRTRQIEARLVSPDYLRYVLTNDRLEMITGSLEQIRVPANTDMRPVCYQYTMTLWLSQFLPRADLLDVPALLRRARDPTGPIAWPRVVALGALMLGFLVAMRRWRTARRLLLVGMAGAGGMVVETALVLAYQVQSGVLYQDLGLLLTAFMAGLALGAAVMDRLWGPSALAGEPLGSANKRRSVGVGLVGAFVAFIGATALALETGWLVSLGFTAVCLLVGGLLVSALFAYVSLLHRNDQRQAVSALYAADLVGGCLGSFAASLLLVPALGMAGALILVAVLLAPAAVLTK